MNAIHAPLQYSAPSDDFANILKRRVRDYFASTGRSPLADARALGLYAFWIASLIGGYAALLYGGLPFWALALNSFWLGITFTAVIFNIAHDAIHNNVFRGKFRNRMLAKILHVVGGNVFIWRMGHHAHHFFTNIHGADDVFNAPIPRLHESMERKFYHRGLMTNPASRSSSRERPVMAMTSSSG